MKSSTGTPFFTDGEKEELIAWAKDYMSQLDPPGEN